MRPKVTVVCVVAGLDGEDGRVLRSLQRQARLRLVGVVQLQPAARLHPHRPRLLPAQSRPRRQRVSLLVFLYSIQWLLVIRFNWRMLCALPIVAGGRSGAGRGWECEY